MLRAAVTQSCLQGLIYQLLHARSHALPQLRDACSYRLFNSICTGAELLLNIVLGILARLQVDLTLTLQTWFAFNLVDAIKRGVYRDGASAALNSFDCYSSAA